MDRRQFIASTAAIGLMPYHAFAAAPRHHLRAEVVTSQVLPEGDGVTRMLGFNGSMPGPELRVRKGNHRSRKWSIRRDGGSLAWHQT